MKTEKNYIKRAIVLLGVAALGVLTIGLFHFSSRFDSNDSRTFPTRAFGGGNIWELEVVATPEERQLGLGERNRLASGHGMLFLFDTPDRYGFWMRGMRFPIDIIFLSRGKVVAVERSIDPSDGRIITPDTPVDQVLEVNAGEASSLSPGNRIWYWR